MKLWPERKWRHDAPFVIVCGGRNYRDWTYGFAVLSQFNALYGPIGLLIEGGARGADAMARSWRDTRILCGLPAIDHVQVRAAWDKLDVPGAVIRRRPDGSSYNMAAGWVRNQKMLDDCAPDAVIAFPGGTGTMDMTYRARRGGVPVIEAWEIL